MNKYFLVRPSAFWRYEDVDIEGNYPRVGVEDFVVSEDDALNNKFNYLIFEVPYKESRLGNKIKYASQARELITGQKFDLIIGKGSESNEDMVILKSKTLGMYLKKPLKLNSIQTKSSKVSGLVNYMKEDTQLFKEYSFCLDTTFEAAYFYKGRHDETLYGPSNSSKRELRRGYSRNIKY